MSNVVKLVPKPKTKKRRKRQTQQEKIQKERARQKQAGMLRHRKTWEQIAQNYLGYYVHMHGHTRLRNRLAKEFAGGAWLLAHEEGLSSNQWLWRESRRALGLKGIQPWTTVPWDVPDLDI